MYVRCKSNYFLLVNTQSALMTKQRIIFLIDETLIVQIVKTQIHTNMRTDTDKVNYKEASLLTKILRFCRIYDVHKCQVIIY